MLKPFKKDKNIPIIFASDEKYAPYLEVTLKTAIDNFSDYYNYDVIILEKNIGDKNKKRLLQLSKENISIRFFDMTKVIQNEDKFYTSLHISTATYYRLFIPEIFKSYKKVIYLDIDLLILEDLAELYNIDIGDNMIAAALDLPLHAIYVNDENVDGKNFREYLKQKLCIPNDSSYFQAGVLVMNLKQMRNNNITQKAIEILNANEKFIYHDQCLLNKLCYGKVFYIENQWDAYKADIKQFLKHDKRNSYITSIEDPKIVHFTGKGPKKPWNGLITNKWAWFWNYKILSLNGGFFIYIKILLQRLYRTLKRELFKRFCTTLNMIITLYLN